MGLEYNHYQRNTNGNRSVYLQYPVDRGLWKCIRHRDYHGHAGEYSKYGVVYADVVYQYITYAHNTYDEWSDRNRHI